MPSKTKLIMKIMPGLVWSVPRKIPAVERFSSSACALSAAEGLVLLQEETLRAPKEPPTAAVYCPQSASSDYVAVVSMFTASEDRLLSPPLYFWPNVSKTAYARVSHAVVLPRDWKGASLHDCLLVWFTEECMDDRPVTALARQLELKNADNFLVQGPVVVCAFQNAHKYGLQSYVGATPTFHGTGQWVHVPNLSTCVRSLSRPFSLVTSEEL